MSTAIERLVALRRSRESGYVVDAMKTSSMKFDEFVTMHDDGAYQSISLSSLKVAEDDAFVYHCF